MLAVENNFSFTVWFGRTQLVRLCPQTSGGKQYSNIGTSGRHSGGRLATMLVATKKVIIFFQKFKMLKGIGNINVRID